MVDVAAQNPLCAAISTKSVENAYLSVVCAAFVKRMAYAKAVLKVGPEPALKLLAAPRFSSQSSEAGRAQDAVEGQILCLRYVPHVALAGGLR